MSDPSPFPEPAPTGCAPPGLLPRLLADQSRRWRAGERPAVEAYLRDHPELGTLPEAVLDLIYNEVLQRGRRGERPRPEEYRRRFPYLAGALRDLFEVHAAVESGSAFRDGSTAPGEGGTAQELPSGGAGAAFPGYEVLGELGRGGMGVVYKARDSRRGRVVALKTMQGAHAAGLYRFKQEFRALADVSHPNLVSLYELVSDGGRWFFTMEFVEGVDLRSHLAAARAAGPASWQRQVRAAFRQVAAGLQALHRAGKLHRDLKPSNVRVDASGRAVILDFGLAAELDREGLHRSTEQNILGTVAYMSPEQAACLPLTPASDWYSVGVMLYEALADRLPFSGAALRVLRDKAAEDPPPPRAFAPEAPADLDALCAALLHRDPPRRPSGAAFLERIDGTAAQPQEAAGAAESRGAAPPFVGRGRHLEALRDAFGALRRGRTVVTLVGGRSGVGKSTLVRHFLDEVRDWGQGLVLSGRCYEQESVPYKAFDGLVDALSRRLARLPEPEAQGVLPRDFWPLARVFPVLGRVRPPAATTRPAEAVDPQEVRRRAFAALRELLGRLGDRAPLVLCIDDLQWADADSAPLLAELLRPPDPPLFLLVGCYRSEDVASSPALGGLLRSLDEAGVAVERRELAVEALSAAEAGELASRLLGSEEQGASALGDMVARESGGNPFFVQELVERLRSGAGPDGGLPGAAELTLEGVLWERVLRLSGEARRLLEVVAVAGRPLGQAAACRAAHAGGRGPAALAELRAGRHVRGTGAAERDEVETYHDKVRETVVDRLGPAALRDCHRRLAVALEEAGGADPEVLAAHWLGADEPGRAAGYYARAGERATAALAFDRAAHLYRLALALGATPGEGEHRLRTALADALANAGRGAEAARQYLAAAAAAPPPCSRELRRRAAMQFLMGGHIDEGTEALRGVLAESGLGYPPTPRRAVWGCLWQSLRLRLRGSGYRPRRAGEVPPDALGRIDTCWAAAVGLSMTDTIRGAYFQRLGLLLALRAGEPTRIARALSLEAMHASIGGERNARRVERALRAAEAAAAPTDDPQAVALVRLARGMAAFLWGRRQAAYRFFSEVERVCRDRGVGLAWELDAAQSFMLACLLYRGEFAEMARRLPVVLREAGERGSLYLDMQARSYVLPMVRLAADEPGEAERELEAETGRWTRQGYFIHHLLALIGGVTICLYRGEGQAAWDRLARHRAAVEGSLLLRVHQHFRVDFLQLRARSALAAAAAAADPRPFVRAAEGDAARLEREKAPWATALACAARAGAAALQGDRAVAARLLAEAAERLAAADMPINAAACRRRLGRLLGGDEGRRLVDQSSAWMADHGVRDPARMTGVYAPGFPE